MASRRQRTVGTLLHLEIRVITPDERVRGATEATPARRVNIAVEPPTVGDLAIAGIDRFGSLVLCSLPLAIGVFWLRRFGGGRRVGVRMWEGHRASGRAGLPRPVAAGGSIDLGQGQAQPRAPWRSRLAG